MKSEERHELAQNDLGKLIERTQSRYAVLVEEHGNRILLWGAAFLMLLVAGVVYIRTANSANTIGWAALNTAQSPEDLATVAEDFKGSLVGDWAKLKVGEQYLQSGVRLLFTDRAASQTDLDEAKAAFEGLLNQGKVSPTVKERALYGMARVLETTSTGDLQPAITAYEKLLQEFPESAYKPVVEKQLALLKKAGAQEFYAWFAEQKPVPQDRDQPSDLLKSLNLNLPEQFDGAAPNTAEMPATETPAGDADSTAQPNPSLTVPAAPEFPPAGGQPAEMKPEAEKPATEPAAPAAGATPEQPKPAPEEKPAEKPAETPAGEAKPATEPAEQPAPAESTEQPAPAEPAPAAEAPPAE